MTVRAPVTSYFDDVNDWLTVGGDLDLAADLTGQTYAKTIKELTKRGVTHVIDARIEWDDGDVWHRRGLPRENYCYVPIVDFWRHTPRDSWYSTIEQFVENFWATSYEGDRLYVHCHMGINRGPSAAMLALLTVEPAMHPFEAFLKVRESRPAAGLVYADVVGARHIAIQSNPRWGSVDEYVWRVRDYWAPETVREATGGVGYYRGADGGTLVVDDSDAA